MVENLTWGSETEEAQAALVGAQTWGPKAGEALVMAVTEALIVEVAERYVVLD